MPAAIRFDGAMGTGFSSTKIGLSVKAIFDALSKYVILPNISLIFAFPVILF